MSGIAAAIVTGGVLTAATGVYGAHEAAEAQTEAIESAAATSAAAGAEARGDINGLYDIARQDYLAGTGQSIDILSQPQAGIQEMRPYADAGLNALQQQAALITDPGSFEESAAQKFYRERQEQSLLRNQAAIGGLGGGNVRTALQEQAAGIAGQYRQQEIQNLGQLTGMGFQAGTNIANLSQQDRINLANIYERQGQGLSGLSTGRGTALANIAVGQGTQQANLTQSAGEARAAGILGMTGAVQSGLQQVAGGAGYALNQPPSLGTEVLTGTRAPVLTDAYNPYTTATPYGYQPTIVA